MARWCCPVEVPAEVDVAGLVGVVLQGLLDVELDVAGIAPISKKGQKVIAS